MATGKDVDEETAIAEAECAQMLFEEEKTDMAEAVKP